MSSLIAPLLVSILFASALAEVDPNYEKETTMTAREANALAQFKKFVIPKIPKDSQLQKYITDDLYFIRWLRATNMDINAADHSFSEHLKWRQTEKIDQIDKEDWSDMEADYKIFGDGVDKYGQPIVELWFGDWPTRTAMLAGKGHRMQRWVIKMFEDTAKRLYEGRQEGKEIGSGALLISLDGFSILEHACPSCLPLYFQTVELIEKQFPLLFSKIKFTDMPPTFEIILQLLRPVMRQETRDALKSYPSREQWMPVLDEFIDKNQRSTRLGGTIKRDA